MHDAVIHLALLGERAVWNFAGSFKLCAVYTFEAASSLIGLAGGAIAPPALFVMSGVSKRDFALAEKSTIDLGLANKLTIKITSIRES